MSPTQLLLEVITQEKMLLQIKAEQVTVMTSSGELTILPGHVSLFTRLSPGVLRYKADGKEAYMAVFGGFMDVSASDRVSILADAADRAEDIDIASVEAAKSQAEKTLEGQFDAPADFALAETALRLIHLRLKVAHLSKGRGNQRHA